MGERSTRRSGGTDLPRQGIQGGSTPCLTTYFPIINENKHNKDGNAKKERQRGTKKENKKARSNKRGRTSRKKRKWRQTSLNGEGYRDDTEWGDLIQQKQENTLRIAFQNINSFSAEKDAPKNDAIRRFLMDHQIDVFGMAEMNKYWPKIEEKNGLYEQTWKGSNPSLLPVHTTGWKFQRLSASLGAQPF